jgi:hypothetical protein
MENTHIGSSLDDFLQEEAMLEEATDVAINRVMAWKIFEETYNLNLALNSR